MFDEVTKEKFKNLLVTLILQAWLLFPLLLRPFPLLLLFGGADIIVVVVIFFLNEEDNGDFCCKSKKNDWQ